MPLFLTDREKRANKLKITDYRLPFRSNRTGAKAGVYNNEVIKPLCKCKSKVFLSTGRISQFPGIHTVFHRCVKQGSTAPDPGRDLILMPLLHKNSFAHTLHTGYPPFFSRSAEAPYKVLHAITVICSIKKTGLLPPSTSGIKK